MKDDTNVFTKDNDTAYMDELINSKNNEHEQIADIDVRPNDSKVLDVLSENNSNYTFRGIMRKLGIHQESLSRSLQRLHELELIEKSQLGYKLSSKGAFLAKDEPRSKISYTPLLQTYLPSNVQTSDIISNITGRWFKNLRWVGLIESQKDHLLKWMSEFGTFELTLRIMQNYITIETNAQTEKDKAEAIVNAYRIMQEVSKVYGNQYGSFSEQGSSNNKTN